MLIIIFPIGLLLLHEFRWPCVFHMCRLNFASSYRNISFCIAHAGEESGRNIFAKRGEFRGTRGSMAMAEGIRCRPYFSLALLLHFGYIC
jgi:hypothetical protein